MANNEDKLLEIFNSDSFGLLETKEKPKSVTADDRLVASFEEINDFYEKHDKDPERTNDMYERKLFSRLQGIKENPEKVEALKPLDRFNLLDDIEQPIIEEFNSIEDILSSNSFDTLLDTSEDIFSFKHTPKPQDRAETDFVARRKPCENFEEYEHLFKKCHINLKNGIRTKMKFSEEHLQEGMFFIIKGVMAYLAKIYDINKDKNSKLDGRTLVIFENGTQSNMLYRSLGKSIYDDGYTISETADDIQKRQINQAIESNDEDTKTGLIYILKSRSTSPEIAGLSNLYKVGLSTTTVEERVKNAEQDPTYLMAAVSIVSTYYCYNLNTQKFEALLHRFFKDSCLDITIHDKKGKAYKPQEWFLVPFEVIEEAIGMIISGEIVDYKYDSYREKIFLKEGV